MLERPGFKYIRQGHESWGREPEGDAGRGSKSALITPSRPPSIMDLKHEVLDIPRALKETLEKGRAEYEEVVRRTRWGEGPLFLIAAGASYYNALSAVHAFESMLGWPAIARRAEEFQAYPISAVRARPVLFVSGAPGGEDAILNAARMTKANGARILALTSDPKSRLAVLADDVFLLRVGEESDTGLKRLLCEQAALSYVAFTAARVLKRHQSNSDALEEEFRSLPCHMEWVFTQLTDAVKTLAAELKSCSEVNVVGGGFFHPIALHAARLLTEFAGINAHGIDPLGWTAASHSGNLVDAQRNPCALAFSGSRCKMKKSVHDFVSRLRGANWRILSVTDANERELTARSTLAVILPSLSEAAGSTLALTLILWSICQPRGSKPERGQRKELPL